MKSINSRSRGQRFSGSGWMRLLVDSVEGVTLKDGRRFLRLSDSTYLLQTSTCVYGYTTVRSMVLRSHACVSVRFLSPNAFV